MSSKPHVTVDVVIVGAGPAGLTAARELKASGVSVAIMEARDRYGGRLETIELNSGAIADIGGQWVAPQHDRVHALIREAGAAIVPTYQKGKSLFYHDRELSRYDGIFPELGDDVSIEIGHAIALLESVVSTIVVEAPWETPGARELDGKTFETWIQEAAALETTRNVLRNLAIGALSSEACDLSLLHVAFYFAAAGGIDNITGIEGAGQDSRFPAGFQRLFAHVALDLVDEIHYNAPVSRIEDRDDRIIVRTEDLEISAQRVIVAISPSLAGRIRYTPPLPALRDQLTQRVPMGTAIKILVSYETPFWRSDGLNGFVISDEAVGLIYDNSPEDGTEGTLLCFIEGKNGRIWGERSPAEREAAVIDLLERYFGPNARSYTQYTDKYWVDEEFSRGCYAGVMPPGVWTSFGAALRRPVGRIHWAGTETATVWPGYVEGAMQSGERAADEVRHAIGLGGGD